MLILSITGIELWECSRGIMEIVAMVKLNVVPSGHQHGGF